MDFLISGTHLSPLFLAGIGLIVGVLGGFFGVGGSFLVGPALFVSGVPMNFVVGTDLAHIVGKSVVAARRHRALGNVDIKFALTMMPGTIVGVEAGAQLIQYLKQRAHVDTIVGWTFIFVLVSISCFIGWESIRALKRQKRSKSRRPGAVSKDVTGFERPLRRLRRFPLPPMMSFPQSGIERLSFWWIFVVAFVGGFFGGFLGGGAGYIRMPAMVYLLGLPTHIAVGTDLFEIIISAGWGTVSHAFKGNVDILIALVMHTGAAVGAQIGAFATQYFAGPRIRLAFVPLPLIGAGIMLYGLLTGHHLK